MSHGTLSSIKARIEQQKECAHPKRDEGRERKPSAVKDQKAVSVIGWVQGFAEEVGDRIPMDDGEEPQLKIPRMELKDIHQEHDATYQDEPSMRCSLPYFSKVFREAKELAHIDMARKLKTTFNTCTTCLTISENISRCLKSHDKVRAPSCAAEHTHTLSRSEQQQSSSIHTS